MRNKLGKQVDMPWSICTIYDLGRIRRCFVRYQTRLAKQAATPDDFAQFVTRAELENA
jgi:hypothetical protein